MSATRAKSELYPLGVTKVSCLLRNNRGEENKVVKEGKICKSEEKMEIESKRETSPLIIILIILLRG